MAPCGAHQIAAEDSPSGPTKEGHTDFAERFEKALQDHPDQLLVVIDTHC